MSDETSAERAEKYEKWSDSENAKITASRFRATVPDKDSDSLAAGAEKGSQFVHMSFFVVA